MERSWLQFEQLGFVFALNKRNRLPLPRFNIDQNDRCALKHGPNKNSTDIEPPLPPCSKNLIQPGKGNSLLMWAVWFISEISLFHVWSR